MVGEALGSTEFEVNIRTGFEFWRKHFIREDGAARYYHDRTYPIDAHCVAQTVLTLLEFRSLQSDNVAMAEKVVGWALEHMRDRKAGYFYYRVLRSCTIRTSYIRWTQVWILLALVSAYQVQLGITRQDCASREMAQGVSDEVGAP
jgi:hypothetical protein